MTNSSTIKRVGWVGLGDQGAPMARAKAEAGFHLHIWVRWDASLAALQGVEFNLHPGLDELGAVADVTAL